jgi:hypothetical protein
MAERIIEQAAELGVTIFRINSGGVAEDDS